MTNLFLILKNFLLELQQTDAQEAGRGVLNFPPEAYDESGRRVFQNLKIGGVATFIVPGREGWNPLSAYFQEIRKAAKENKSLNITRIFILPHLHYMRESKLIEHWQLDTQAGIDVKFVVLGKEVLQLLAKGTLDFGIWDDDIVGWYINPKQGMSDAAPKLVFSNRGADLEIYRHIRDQLLSQAFLSQTPVQARSEFALTEPLLQTAPMADMLADFVCKGSHLDRESCSWYHKAWQYLRILDLVSTPSWHSEFYLKRVPEETHPVDEMKILISGTADYSVLAYVMEAFAGRVKDLDITVLDMCETPLLLCEWYSKTKNMKIRTIHQDLFSFEPEEKFDLIITDAFLTRFAPLEKKQIVSKWHGLLKVGGRIATTIRVGDRSATRVVRASATEAKLFAEAAFTLAALWGDFVQKQPDYIKDLAAAYASKMGSWPLDEESTLNLFSHEQFTVVHKELATVKGEMKATSYMRILLARN